jgi:hypothetical protein
VTKVDREHIKETLLACYAEFEELMYTKDWFVTSVVDQIESSLEILDNVKED